MPKKSQLEVVSQGSQQHNTSKKTEIKQFSSGEQIQNQPIKINKETHATDVKRIHQEVNQSVIWTKLHPLLLHLQHRKHSLFTCIENTRLCKIPYTKVDNILNSTSCPLGNGKHLSLSVNKFINILFQETKFTEYKTASTPFICFGSAQTISIGNRILGMLIQVGEKLKTTVFFH